MKDETGLELIAFGMCLANKKLLAATNPEDFTDDDIRQAVGELKAPRVEGQPEPEMRAVLGLLERLGAEPRKFGSLSEAVQAGVREYTAFVECKKVIRGMADVGLIGRQGTPAGRRAFVQDVKKRIGELP